MSARELRSLLSEATTLTVPGRDVELGDAVKAKYKASVHGPACTMWYTGTVAEVHEDGTVDVRYEDGDYEAHVRREYVKPLKLALPAGMSEAAD